MTTEVIIYTNTISGSSSAAVSVAADEALTIAPGVLVVGTNGNSAIVLPGVTADGSIDVEGFVGGDIGINFLYNQGSETVTVGHSGSIVGQGSAGIFLDNTGSAGSQAVGNAGTVSGSVYGVQLTNRGNGTRVENSGTITGGTAGIYLSATAGAVIVNDASGEIVNGIAGVSSAAQISNAGTISSTAYSPVIDLGVGSTVSNSGDIQGVMQAVDFEGTSAGGGNRLQNSGTIAASGNDAIDAAGGNNYIENSGKISATAETIHLSSSSNSDRINNDTGGIIEAESDEYAIEVDGASAHILNRGDIVGAIFAEDAATFTNTGNYYGEAAFSGGNVIIRNAGTMSYDGFATLAADAQTTSGMAPAAALLSGENVYIAGASGETDLVTNAAGGVIDATGEVAIYHGAAGTLSLTNLGEIFGDLSLNSQTRVINGGTIGGDVGLAGSGSSLLNRGLIDGSVTYSGTGNTYFGTSGVVTGAISGAGADGRYFGGADNDVFDMTASGASVVSGGAGDDTFLFTAKGLTAAATVKGGTGADTLTFSTAGTIPTSAFAHVSGVDAIDLAAGTNVLTLTNALVTASDADTLTVNGGTGRDTIDASAVGSATNTVAVYGGGNGDTIVAGAAKDVFGYTAVSDSTGPFYDTISNANLNLDSFDVSAVAGSIAAINPAVSSGSLSTSTFNTNLASDLPAAKLGAHDAVLFTASAGTLTGQTFLVVDVNGTAGYQGNADLVIHLTGATGTLSTSNFV